MSLPPVALPSGDEASEATLPPGPSLDRESTDVYKPLRTPSGAGESTLDDPWVGGYQVLEEIGAGAMATIRRGFQPSLGRPVAVKTLRSEYLHDAEIVGRFEREAASLGQLQHENVVGVLDVITAPNGERHIVTELVEGVDLFDLLEAARRVPPDIVALIALQCSRGLEHAHARGIVHRDIKPSNIFVSKQGEVKLMDFGIAWDPTASELTQIGLSVGTPEYMAPEQIRGETVDPRTDQFAFGIVMYELLTGEPPWRDGRGRNVALDVLRTPHAPLARRSLHVPPDLVHIVERCLQKSPVNRWPSTARLRSALEGYAFTRGLVDPRSKLVLYLAEKGFVTSSEAAEQVPPELEVSAAAPRSRIDEDRILGPITVAHALGLVVILASVVLTRTAPIGLVLPEGRPSLTAARVGAQPLSAPLAED